MSRGAVLLATALFISGCMDADDAPQDEAEASSGSQDTDTDAFSCQSSPVLTYDTFGTGFLATYCNGCHGAGAVNRQGAPEMVVFDDAEQTSMWLERIETRVFAPEGQPAMPPAGGITPDDLERARIWLECYP